MIWVTPFSHLDETLRQSKAQHVLSLLSAGSEPVSFDGLRPDQCLHLAMHDIAEPREGLIAPSIGHVREILAFGDRWGRQAPLLIHCYAGISRSTAAAYVIASALQPKRNEEDLALELRRLAPSATPNPLIVAHADALLGRDGRMIAAIRKIGRGEEAFEGTPFSIEIGQVWTGRRADP
jgi:predicted protein tyrosine phosphatase